MPDSPERAPLILIADDVPANIELLVDQLTALGYRTVTAEDGPSAMEAAFKHKPDLCILDVAMPAGDLDVDHRSTGFEVCRRIKRDARTARIPVIFVTALNDTTDRVKAIEAGGDDFLTKPHNRLLLSARVRSLLKLKSTTDALEDSYRKLRELEKVRDDLMKMIVHDLKTPLTSVIATLEMLTDGDFGELSGQQKSAVSEVEAKSQELLALIEDILEVARIEETGITLALAEIQPRSFIEELLHEWDHRFQQEKTRVIIEVDELAPAFQGDKGLIKRVFANLIQNAVTHSAKPINLRLAARRNGESVLFAVVDDGPGIPEEYHDIIFRKFGQVHSENAPRVRSSGLGLTFCKLVVDLHGGRIWVKSNVGEGSSFYVELPRRPATFATMPGLQAPSTASAPVQ